MNRTIRPLLAAAALTAAGMIGGLTAPLLAGADTTYSESHVYQPASEPQRVIDTRDPGHARLSAGVPITIDIPSVLHTIVADGAVDEYPSVPALAVAVNLTVVQPDGAGYLTAWPAGRAQPAVSNVNFSAGEDESNFAIVPVTNGQIQLVSSVDADVIVDLFGQYDGIVVFEVP